MGFAMRTFNLSHIRRHTVLVAAGLAMAMGVVALLGWVLQLDILKSLIPGAVQMKPNTAIGLCLSAAALLVGLRRHVCRTVARRAERAVVALGAAEPLKDAPRQYLNRLSDLLFVLSRVLNRMVITYTNLKATSGSLSASGQAKIANRQIEAEFAVDLVDGIVGVPLSVSGPLEDVKFSVPKSAIAGAVVGTAVLPGVGTAIGARIGATLGKIFSPGPASPASAPARAVSPARNR